MRHFTYDIEFKPHNNPNVWVLLSYLIEERANIRKIRKGAREGHVPFCIQSPAQC